MRLEPMTDTEYLQAGGNKCPFCESDQVEGSEINIDTKSAWQEVRCNDCGGDWNDLYQLVGYQKYDP